MPTAGRNTDPHLSFPVQGEERRAGAGVSPPTPAP
jgi:hypothetical protein